jgi:hypothetical protein
MIIYSLILFCPTQEFLEFQIQKQNIQKENNNPNSESFLPNRLVYGDDYQWGMKLNKK